MSKYTFVFEFKGGTYLSQVSAKSIGEAIRCWAEEINIDEIKFMGHASKNELINLSDSLEPILINGMDNVWCVSGLLRSGFFMANIVAS